MTPIWTALIAGVIALVGWFGPLAVDGDVGPTSLGSLVTLGLVLLALVGAYVGRFWTAVLLVPVGLAGALVTVLRLGELTGGWGYWALLWGFWLVVVFGVGRVSVSETPEVGRARLRSLLPSASVPFLLLLAWQGLVGGYQIPKGIFPGIDDVWRSLVASWPVLLRDSYVTFVKEVLLGFSIGLVTGFLMGIAVAFSRFLRRGFLPLAAAFGAVPIVGLAPVLGRAFGVDWESKAAVVVIVTFFPVLLNTVQGLVSVETLKLELLHAYAAKPHEIFFKLRLPNALPYLFNALKLAAVISVVSVIVAEFLIPGPPEGLGQRISLSARRGAFDVVFAAIFVSSAISIAFYGLIGWLERLTTSWHPSMRDSR
ncbi:MAG: ABC transporter permease [Trueperaceae bacterium]|nr:ABC transporter permease [Trueperaceae bacterium]